MLAATSVKGPDDDDLGQRPRDSRRATCARRTWQATRARSTQPFPSTRTATPSLGLRGEYDNRSMRTPVGALHSTCKNGQRGQASALAYLEDDTMTASQLLDDLMIAVGEEPASRHVEFIGEGPGLPEI